MTNVALIFPGQGAQSVGMGKTFYDSSSEAKAIFDQADQVIDGLSDVIFNGPQEKLTSTAFCQPGILTFSIAALKAFETHSKFKNIEPKATAGLSLGEYSALAAADALSFEDTIKLVERRSSFMEEATSVNKGTMAAIIGFDQARLEEICQETGAEVANFNSPQQIVITGFVDKVQAACDKIREEGAKSVIPLDVSGAFHSSLMQPAADKFKDVLTDVAINEPKFSVLTNVNGREEKTTEEIRENLAKQITSSVQWVETVNNMVQAGVKDFIEIGPGKVLCGLIRRIDRGLNVYNIETPEDIEKLPF